MKKRLIYFCSVIVLLASLLFLFLSTNTGLKVGIKLLNRFVPGQLTIKNSLGTWLSSVTLEDLHYSNQTVDITVGSLTWDHMTFANRVLHIGTLFIKDLTVVVKPSQPNSPPFSLQNLKNNLDQLKFIDVQTIKIENTTVFYDQYIFKPSFIAATKIRPRMYTVEMRTLYGNVHGAILAGWMPVLKWAVQLTADNINLNSINQALIGTVHGVLSSAGKWDDKGVNAKIKLDKLSGMVNRSNLNGHIDITFANNEWHFKDSFISLADNQLNFKGDIGGDNQTIDWNVSIPRFNAFYPSYRGSLFFTGKFNKNTGKYYLYANLSGKDIKLSSVKIADIKGTVTTALTPVLSRGTLIVNKFSMGNYQIPKITLSMLSQVIDHDLRQNIAISLNPPNRLKADITIGNVNQFFENSPALTGRIDIRFDDPSSLLHSQYLKQLKGSVRGVLTLAGTIARPVLGGSLAVTNGRFALSALGITLRDINVQSSIGLYKPFQFSGSFVSGSGRGMVKGTVNVYDSYFPFQVNLSGNNLQAVNLKEYQIKINPQVSITHSRGKNLDIAGSVQVPYVQIVTETIDHGVNLPAEVIIVGKQPTQLIQPANLSMQLHVTIGEHAHVTYQNLSADLAGALSVSQLSGGIPTATGVLRITKGSYFLYNQYLTIDNGRLLYVGNPLNNPALDVRAIKQITSSYTALTLNQGDVDTQSGAAFVGALVQGTLKNRQITLISNPPMNQDDILSYLMFGTARAQLSGVNSLAALNLVASSLHLMPPNASDGDSSAGQTNPLMGLLNFGTFNPLQGLNFSLPLGKHWVIRTESSIEQTGADIMYRYEHD